MSNIQNCKQDHIKKEDYRNSICQSRWNDSIIGCEKWKYYGQEK